MEPGCKVDEKARAQRRKMHAMHSAEYPVNWEKERHLSFVPEKRITGDQGLYLLGRMGDTAHVQRHFCFSIILKAFMIYMLPAGG